MAARFAELGAGTTDKSASFAAIGETRRLHLRNENRFPCKCSIPLLQREKPTKPFRRHPPCIAYRHRYTTPIEQMKPPKRRNQIGRLELFFSAAALLLTIGSIVGPWTFNPLIALVLLAVVYGVLRDLRALKGLRKPVPTQHTPRKSHAERMDHASR